MKKVTTYKAKTQLSSLIKEARAGEEVIILHGTQPVARLVAYGETEFKPVRPKVGQKTSENVAYDDDVFAPLSDEALDEWGL